MTMPSIAGATDWGREEPLTEVRELILSARQTVATAANATLTMLHW
jgi:hypothetical protein